METTKELPGIARLKINPGNREAFNLPSRPRYSRSNLKGNKPVASPGNHAQLEPFSPQSLVTYYVTFPSP